MLSRHWLTATLRAGSTRGPHALRCFSATRLARDVTPSKLSYEEKYAEKLQRRAQECVRASFMCCHRLTCSRQGKSVADLCAELKEQEKQRRLQRLREESSKAPQAAQGTPASTTPSSSSSSSAAPSVASSSRRDSSPVKVRGVLIRVV